MFRRRHRGDADSADHGGSQSEYPAAGELAGDQVFPDERDEAAGFGDLEDEDAAEFGDLEDGEAAEFGDLEDEEAAEFGDLEDEEGTAAGGAGADVPHAAAPRVGRDDLGDPVTWTRLRDSAPVEPAMSRSAGPWDSESGFPAEVDRVDFGSLLVPARDGLDVQVFMSEEAGISIAVVSGESGLQLQPFAAPRSSGLWDEVRPEIAEEVAKAGGRSAEQDGPFGPELLAWVSPEPGSAQPLQPLRFMGVDGPRWFLRGLISGPAATDAALARQLEEVFADVVVVRGDHAEPPRKPLDIQLPEEARQALQSQLEAEQPGLPNPFERGPEITETR